MKHLSIFISVFFFTFANAAIQLVPTKTDPTGRTPLHQASCLGDISMVKAILSDKNNPQNARARDNKGRTPMYDASYAGNTEIVQILLKANANPYVKDNKGRAPIQHASYFGSTEVFQLLSFREKPSNIVPKKNNKGNTLLHEISCFGIIYPVKVLLQNKHNLNARDNKGRTPLHYASYFGNTKLVQNLLKANANPYVKDNKGRAPIQHASYAGNTEIVQILSSLD